MSMIPLMRQFCFYPIFISVQFIKSSLIFSLQLRLILVVTCPPDGSMGSFHPCLLGDGLGKNLGLPGPVRGG